MHDQAECDLLQLQRRRMLPKLGQNGEPPLLDELARIGLERLLDERILDRLLDRYTLARALHENALHQADARLRELLLRVRQARHQHLAALDLLDDELVAAALVGRLARDKNEKDDAK